MARTWPASRWKSALVNTIDFFGRPAAAVYRAAKPVAPLGNVKRILVIELWQIGDVVLTTPFLAALRECFPGASIALLAKPHAAEILEGTGLVDEFVAAQLPWTRTAGKYDPSAYLSAALAPLIRSLRERRFDLSFDARMDIRSNILASLSGARRRVGFRYGGGDWLLTDSVPIDPRANHKIDDWLALLAPVGCTPKLPARCLLKTSELEKADARAAVAGVARTGVPLVGIHPGASHAGKRWPLSRFIELARKIRESGSAVVVFADDRGFGRELGEVNGALVTQSALRPMMALIEQCDVLVCNDSGPMHIAAALGVPTIAIFERGEPRWFGPVGKQHVVLEGERSGIDISAAPASEDPPNPVPVVKVFQAVMTQLARHSETMWS
jgi:ADP-heptose:LPS heptosyltransferase